ncbi:P-type conjugative transfer protein TrbL (plasmid) [Campylobacter jejuni]|uniref:P-type conjugative transfer protein TrbL n=1 Tax=Campylobacter jejuni TaxID=197 RepID=A0A5T1SR90_CAMJU|nr:P-type conjugative transfer protein TrbL [Campylobacter jejuni]EKG3605083.1 P-type conjugative transfer protein TrbL [Campylobacter upsaliensis]EAH5194890.1 P-type conjugative transfer protein TrbL [Campylobacter jejuni]EAH5328216.1 P-type conjugative transfer protein TrbL [Campylobacter jejuni]EAH7631324.1 P-type conjugative transfer protein TrbL [Campylobacter jejuni]EAH7728176.1 P-type conjugative transfer protein TrbL [Campylobacter jejuni]
MELAKIKTIKQTPLNGNKLRLILIFCFLIPNLAFGAETAEGVLNILRNGLLSWTPLIKTACLWVFFTLVVIDLVWTFGLKALSGFEFGEFLATLIKKIIYIGIFIFLFNVDYWLQIIFNSFSQLATNVNNGLDIYPSNIIQNAFKIVMIILKSMSVTSPGESFFKVISGIIILIAFVLMAIDLLIVYLKFFLMNVIIYFALALGGLNHFKQIGLNPIMSAIKIGVELFMIQGLMALCITIIEKTYNEMDQEISYEITLAVLVTSLIFCMITKMIPGIIEAVFNGSIGESAGAAAGFRAIATMAAGAATGAAVGAVGVTRAMNAAKELHLAEGGKGGMDLVKGVAKHLATSGGEHLRDNLTKGRMPHQMANRLQEKLKDIQGKASEGGISSGTPKEESYQSGVNPNAM